MANSWITTAWGASIGGYAASIPEDAEDEDKEIFAKSFEKYMNRRYPAFEPEVIHAMDKDYYLPALKVLSRTSKGLFSP